MEQALDKIRCFKNLDEVSEFAPHGIAWDFTVSSKPPRDAVVVKQVHGIAIRDAELVSGGDEGDGLYLVKSGKIAVKSADCLPILLAAPGAKPMVFALHAGWRSLAGGIVQEAAKIWQQQKRSGAEFYALLGPTLCRQHFEVGPEVVAAFAEPVLGLSKTIASAGKGDRSHIDLAEAAAVMLITLGLNPQAIAKFESCTYCHPELWPSYRRDRGFEKSIWSSVAF